jgi:ribosomal protein L7/L12
MPTVLLVVALAVLAAGLLLFVLTRRRGGDIDLVASQMARRTKAAPAPLSDAALRRKIEMLLAGRGKIEAIKLLREQRPQSLRDAKAEVERIQAGRPAAVPRVPAGVDATVLAQVRDLKRRGRTIEAIKLLRQRTGMSLRDAKEAVERM